MHTRLYLSLARPLLRLFQSKVAWISFSWAGLEQLGGLILAAVAVVVAVAEAPQLAWEHRNEDNTLCQLKFLFHKIYNKAFLLPSNDFNCKVKFLIYLWLFIIFLIFYNYGSQNKKSQNAKASIIKIMDSGDGPVMHSEDEPSLLFLLLSHHSPKKLHRTIHIRIRRRDLYLCARCTGIWAGILSILLAFFLGLGLPPWLYILLWYVLPAPAIIDWITQSCKLRESKNTIRVGTGYLLGIGLGLVFLLLAKGMLYLFLFALMILGVYILSIYIIARKTNFLDDYLDQYSLFN